VSGFSQGFGQITQKLGIAADDFTAENPVIVSKTMLRKRIRSQSPAITTNRIFWRKSGGSFTFATILVTSAFSCKEIYACTNKSTLPLLALGVCVVCIFFVLLVAIDRNLIDMALAIMRRYCHA
jgi:hypothetical protein